MLHQVTICFFTETWHKTDLSLGTEFGDKELMELAVESVHSLLATKGDSESWSGCCYQAQGDIDRLRQAFD
jgi:hypothetical protein